MTSVSNQTHTYRAVFGLVWTLRVPSSSGVISSHFWLHIFRRIFFGGIQSSCLDEGDMWNSNSLLFFCRCHIRPLLQDRIAIHSVWHQSGAIRNSLHSWILIMSPDALRWDDDSKIFCVLSPEVWPNLSTVWFLGWMSLRINSDVKEISFCIYRK